VLILPLSKQDESAIPILTLFMSFCCGVVFLFVGSESDKLALAYYPGSFNVLRMFTSVFVHADIFHLLGNLFFFYCFARTIESELTVKGYLISFAAFVLATNTTYSVFAKDPIPTIGLSGVVWGFMGIFLMRYPTDNINCFVWYLWIVKRIGVPAFIFVLAFLAFDIGAFREEAHGNVNYVAHFSGFVAGALLKIGLWEFDFFVSRRDTAARSSKPASSARTRMIRPSRRRP